MPCRVSTVFFGGAFSNFSTVMVRPRVYGTTFSSTKVHSAKLSSFRRSEVMTGEAIMAIQRVGVIGSGTMGNGIAHVFAQRGFNVVLCDVEQRFLDRGLDTIAKNLDREVAKNKITAGQHASSLGNMSAAGGSADTRWYGF